MLKIGLTGGIGSGKSTVARLFADLNVPIIDADEIAHQLVEPGQPALEQIRRTFGEEVINYDGSLNRHKLREIVFSDVRQKQALEAIVHPLVFRRIQKDVDALNVPYCIISIPLLFETNVKASVDRILVVDCPIETQIERVKKRDRLNEAAILAIIASQVSRETRINGADDLIDNSESNYRLAEQVKNLHNLYLSLSDR